MRSYKKQIVCISPQYWDEFWFRKQHFMIRFRNKGYKIAYINPSFSFVRKPNMTEHEYANNKNNLFIISPSQYLPYWTRFLFSEINRFYIFSRLSFLLKKLGFQNYILWIYRATDLYSIKYFNYKKLVFDMCDDLPGYEKKYKWKYQYINNCTNSLVKNSDLVFVTAHMLLKKYKNLSTNIHLIPNGYDSDLFNHKNLAFFPQELSNMSSPIIGFVGTLFEFLDYDLIENIVIKNPDKKFVFVGPCNSIVKKRWEDIIKYKNVLWLGKRKKEEIPSIISKFDLCINPFKMDEISKSVSPLKVFEYLAMRKPVVSIEMKSLMREKVGKLIYFASDTAEFNKKIDYALKNKIPESEYEGVKEYTWDNLFNKVYYLVENTIN